ncbi:Cut9-interacting protein scn1 [Malassezia equina]|uniref:Cut9-interacting protein scn1 n=1 Tax=Malassezia equina TaxID=1381935 RepID=A0AAF0J0J7_9BASI|nr:Cut9-interacting protein scn1 [Malassezia equina]
MSTDAWDQRLVARAAAAWPGKVVPAFGVHPWCVHTLSLSHPAPPAHEHYEALLGPGATELLPHLPPPVSLTEAMAQLEAYLVAHPTALVGEVGLDRSFRIPIPHTSPRRLSRCQTPLAHQLAVLRAQITLAGQYGRSISMHSVRAAGATSDLLATAAAEIPGFRQIGVLLHSCTLSVPSLVHLQRTYPNVFVSFSTAIQTQHTTELMRASDPARVVCESDYHAWAELAPRTTAAIEAYGKARDIDINELMAQLADNFLRYYHYVDTMA